MKLGWTANTDTDLGGYRVYFGSQSGKYQQNFGLGLDAGTSVQYTVPGLNSGTTYYFAITAYDKAGNESALSAEVSGVAP